MGQRSRYINLKWANNETWVGEENWERSHEADVETDEKRIWVVNDLSWTAKWNTHDWKLKVHLRVPFRSGSSSEKWETQIQSDEEWLWEIDLNKTRDHGWVFVEREFIDEKAWSWAIIYTARESSWASYDPDITTWRV